MNTINYNIPDRLIEGISNDLDKNECDPNEFNLEDDNI